jgi:hypothetical protein
MRCEVAFRNQARRWQYPRLFAALLALLLPEILTAASPSTGTTPLLFDANRIYAQVTFIRPDGSSRLALAYVDLGSPSMLVSETLYRELQLDQKKPLTFKVGDKSSQVEASAVTRDNWLPFTVGNNRKVEALLPAGVLQRYVVVIDYARHELTLADSGALKPEGEPVACRVDEKTGLAVVDASIDGHSYPITIDAGSAYTWLGKAEVQQWLAQHPDWQRGVGAVGTANMRMDDDGIEAAGILIRIPEIKIGLVVLQNVGALAIGPSKSNWDFIDWYSKKNAAPVIGWLGGNVLRDFRITIDYPNRMIYWQRERKHDPHEIDQIGLTLIHKEGEYFVAAVATQNGKPTVEDVQAGDKLVEIDALHTKGATSSTVLSALHGKPGETRILVLERDGKRLTVQAKVTAFQ